MENVVDRKVLRVGSSLGVIIPKDFAKELDLQAGDEIQIELCQDGIVLTPIYYDEDFEEENDED